jgi:type II secretory pathway pseudopilin PulG
MPAPRGFSILGVLVAMACVIILMAIMLPAVQKAKTTARSIADANSLSQLYASMIAVTYQPGPGLPTPSEADGSKDAAANTTANLYSLLITQMTFPPSMLISSNERNPYIWADEDYNYSAINPAAGVHWDPSFKADLANESNVSFAHMPLFGDRYDRHWKGVAMDSRFPILGNRGPKDGRYDPESYTIEDGRWVGAHILAR